MRIALDGSDLAAERVEGPSVYTGELLPRLSRFLTERGHAVTTYVPAPPRGVKIVGGTRLVPGSPFWTQRFFAAALRRDRPDVLFMPIQMLPLFRPRGTRTVAVVHDLEFLHYPETYTPANRILLRWFTRHAVQNATRLITVSQYTKDDVVRAYGRPPEDVTVVHHGVAMGYGPEALGHNSATDARGRYGLPERYVLFVGALQPRKNIEGLIMAFEEVEGAGDVGSRVSGVGRQEIGSDDLHLVIVGGGGWKSEGILRRIGASPVRDRIHVLRRVPHEDLSALYAHAAAFVLPSFSEGFGMPVLEAMAAGTPVITSNTSSLPEVAGDAALLVNPQSPSAIASAILRALREPRLREQLIAKGRVRAATFTWDRAAEHTAAVIERAGADK